MSKKLHTADDLDALPIGAVIRTGPRNVYEKVQQGARMKVWECVGDTWRYSSEVVIENQSPAVVLFSGGKS